MADPLSFPISVVLVCCECKCDTAETHDDMCPPCWYVTHGGDLAMRYLWPPYKRLRVDGANVFVQIGEAA